MMHFNPPAPPSFARHLLAAAILGLLAPLTPAAVDAQPAETSEPSTDAPAEAEAASGDGAAGDPEAGEAEAAKDEEAPDPAVLEIRVAQVEGMVQVRPEGGEAWQAVEPGMVLGAGAELRTGPRSAVHFIIDPDQHVTLDRLGTVKILNALKKKDHLDIDLGMKYGRTEYEVEAGGVEHESAIHSPGATLAVRGTVAMLENDGLTPPRVVVIESREARFSNWRGEEVTMERGEVSTETPTPTAHARRRAARATHPNGETLTRSELAAREDMPLLEGERLREFDLTNRRLRFAAARRTSLRIAERNVLPGRLNFILNWQGDADVDLGVQSPASGDNFLTTFPTSANGGSIAVPSGGRVTADHLGPNGLEIAFWGESFPEGTYELQADLFSGQQADIRMRTVLDGNQIDFHEGQLNPLNPSAVRQVEVLDPQRAGSETLD